MFAMAARCRRCEVKREGRRGVVAVQVLEPTAGSFDLSDLANIKGRIRVSEQADLSFTLPLPSSATACFQAVDRWIGPSGQPLSTSCLLARLTPPS